jgi:hypothetical protein
LLVSRHHTDGGRAGGFCTGGETDRDWSAVLIYRHSRDSPHGTDPGPQLDSGAGFSILIRCRARGLDGPSAAILLEHKFHRRSLNGTILSIRNPNDKRRIQPGVHGPSLTIAAANLDVGWLPFTGKSQVISPAGEEKRQTYDRERQLGEVHYPSWAQVEQVAP